MASQRKKQLFGGFLMSTKELIIPTNLTFSNGIESDFDPTQSSSGGLIIPDETPPTQRRNAIFEPGIIPELFEKGYPRTAEWADTGEAWTLPQLDFFNENKAVKCEKTLPVSQLPKKTLSIGSGKVSKIEELFFLLYPLVADLLIFCKGEAFFRDEKRSNVFIPLQEDELLLKLRGLLNIQERLRYGNSLFKEVVKNLQLELEVGSVEQTFNSQEHLVNFKNGVVSISDGEARLVDEDPEIRFTYCVDANFDESVHDIPAALRSLWETSLHGDLANLKMLLEFVGYSLCDTVAGKVIMLMVGLPNSGKSVVCRFLQALLPQTSVTTFALHQIGEKFNGQSLCQAKLNISSEIESQPLKVGAMLKACSGGGDRIAAERKFRDPQFMTVRTKLLGAGNDLPHLETGDPTDAIFERLAILPFSQRVTQKDPHLLSKLLSERDEICSLAMAELAKLIERGFEFTWSAEARATLAGYRRTANSLLEFCSEHLEFYSDTKCGNRSDYRIPCRELYDQYREFCADAMLPAIGKGAFISFINSKGATSGYAYKNGTQRRAYIGVRYQFKKENNYESTELEIHQRGLPPPSDDASLDQSNGHRYFGYRRASRANRKLDSRACDCAHPRDSPKIQRSGAG